MDPLGLREVKPRNHWWQFWRSKWEPVDPNVVKNFDIIIVGKASSKTKSKNDKPSLRGVHMMSKYGQGRGYGDGIPWQYSNIDWVFEFIDIFNAFFFSSNKFDKSDAEQKMIQEGPKGLDVITKDSDIKKTKTGPGIETDNKGGTQTIKKQEKIEMQEEEKENLGVIISIAKDTASYYNNAWSKKGFTESRLHYPGDTIDITDTNNRPIKIYPSR